MQEEKKVAIELEIYEKIRYYNVHTNLSQRQVAKTLGVSRNTVKKYWNGESVPWDRKPGSGRSNDVVTEEVKEFISECLELDKTAPKKQVHTAHRIFERLKTERNFRGSETAIRKTVAEMRKNISKAFVPLAYTPGETIQVDWGEATVYEAGTKIKVQLWCMRECYSGDIFVSAFRRQNEESFLEGIQKGLEYFRGVPEKILFDNARVAVKEGFGKHAKATDRYQALSAHYSFKPVFCNIASGHEKGLVEGLVGLVRRRMFAPVPHIETIEELNDLLINFCQNYRKHKIPSKPETVEVMANESMSRLNALPPYRFDTSRTIQIKADEFSLVKFDYNRYSVPYHYSLKNVTVKGYGNQVSIIADSTVIASYIRDYNRNNTHYQLEHYIDLIAKKPRSVFNAAPVKQCVPDTLYSFLMKLDKPDNIVKTLRLYIEHGESLLQYLPDSSSYEELLINISSELNHSKSIDSPSEIKVKKRDLSNYDTLLMKGAV